MEHVTCRTRLPFSMHLVACLDQTLIPFASLVKCTELSQAVGFLALVSGIAIGSAVDDSRPRDRLILFLSGRCVQKHFKHLSLAVKCLVPRWKETFLSTMF